MDFQGPTSPALLFNYFFSFLSWLSLWLLVVKIYSHPLKGQEKPLVFKLPSLGPFYFFSPPTSFPGPGFCRVFPSQFCDGMWDGPGIVIHAHLQHGHHKPSTSVSRTGPFSKARLF